MINYRVDNLTLMEDEKSFLVDITIELEDYELTDENVYISITFPLANDSNDVEDIKEKAVTHAKNILKRVLLEDAQQDLF